MNVSEPYEEIDRAEVIRETRGHHYEVDCLKAQRKSLEVRAEELFAMCEGLGDFDQEGLRDTADDIEKFVRELRDIARAMERVEDALKQASQ